MYNCNNCNDNGWYFVNEWFGGLQGRKDCYCKIPCQHSDTTLVPIDASKKHETTVIQCDYCGKFLTEPKTVYNEYRT